MTPMDGLFGDLMKLMGRSSGGTPWLDAARALAQSVATDGAEETNVEPVRRIEIEELARVAELHVANATGLPVGAVGAGGKQVRFAPVGRGVWAVRAVESWRPWLEKMVAAQTPPPAAGGAAEAGAGLGAGGDLEAGGLGGLGEGPGGIADMLQRVAGTIGPIFTGLQFGSAAGHLAQRALGHYALPVPRPDTTELLIVPDNIAAFASDWSLPLDQTELWVCVRELTAHALLSRPVVAERIVELLDAVIADSAASQHDLAARLTEEAGNPEYFQHMLEDPEALLADLVTPGHRRVSAQLVAATTAVGAAIDHVTTTIAGGLIGAPGALSEAWYRHRSADVSGEVAAGALFGLDLSREQVDRGAAFVRGVLERAGDEGLARLWSAAAALPTPAELDAPGLWLERLDLDAAGSGS